MLGDCEYLGVEVCFVVGENEAPAEDVEDDVAVAPARSSNPAPSTRT